MFAKDEEIFITIISSTVLMVFLVAIIIFAVIRYQNKLRKHLQEINDLRIAFHNEVLIAQLEKEEQTLHRISQEIHDNIGQLLSLVKLNLNTMDLSNCNPLLQDKVTLTKELVSKTINDLRQLSKSLNSIHITQHYLSHSLQLELDVINKIGQYITKLSVKGEEKLFDPQKQLILFRIAQEALNNIIKHAQAKQIIITLNYEADSLYMTIEDDGIGFHNNALNQIKGTGIGNINYRAELIGANLIIDSKKNIGTTIKIVAPYNQLIS
jgi:two-component system, NarL family, sensor kinase